MMPGKLCCSDGPGNAEYSCLAGTFCGKGQCVPAGKMLCTDGPGATDYVCLAGETCGRGVCVLAGKTLCGTSGTHTCLAGTYCCGPSAADKNSGPFTCPFTCPIDQMSDITYTSTPYVSPPGRAYGAAGSAGSSPMGMIIGGAAAVILLGGAGYWYKKRGAARAKTQLKAKENVFQSELPSNLPGAVSSAQVEVTTVVPHA